MWQMLFVIVAYRLTPGVFVPLLLWLVRSTVLRPSPKDRQGMADVKQLKAEQAQVHMVDQFAKHAKLERRIVKLETELKASAARRDRYLLIVGTTLRVICYLSWFVATLYLMFVSRRQPGLAVPEKLLSLLPSSFGEVNGVIEIPMWIAMPTFVFSTNFILSRLQLCFGGR